MRISRTTGKIVATAALAVAALTACTTTAPPANSTANSVSIPASATVDPMTDVIHGGPCTDGIADARTVAPRLQYMVQHISWDNGPDGELQLAVGAQLMDLPSGYALYSYLQRDGKCRATSFGGKNNLVVDDPSGSYGFNLLSTVPQRFEGYQVSTPDDCPGYYTMLPDGKTCAQAVTRDYQLVLIMTPRSAQTKADDQNQTPVPANQLVDKLPPGSLQIMPTGVFTEQK